MQQQGHILLAILLLAGLILSGCSKSVNGPNTTFDQRDIAAMKKMIESDPLFTSDPSILDDGDVVTFGPTSLGKVTSPISPIGWGRWVTSRSMDTQFENVNDTTVVATVTHTIKGDLIILVKSGVRDSVTRIKKPFTTVTTRKVKFYREGKTGDPSFDWRPNEVSGVKGGTVGSQITIHKVEVNIGNDTYTITDPTSDFFQLGRMGRRPLPVLNPGQPMRIRVTLTSADPDTDWVSLHRPSMMVMIGPNHQIRALHIRMHLVSQAPAGSNFERVYEYSWTGNFVGRHTVFVEAITRSSLFDDTAPFSTQLWGVPYVVQ